MKFLERVQMVSSPPNCVTFEIRNKDICMTEMLNS